MFTSFKVSRALALTAVIAIVLSLFIALIISFSVDASSPKVFSMVGAVTTGVGAIVGAVGASSLYLTPEQERDAIQESETSAVQIQETAIDNPKQKPAIDDLKQKAELKDAITAVGWSLVIVGAIASSIGVAITP